MSLAADTAMSARTALDVFTTRTTIFQSPWLALLITLLYSHRGLEGKLFEFRSESLIGKSDTIGRGKANIASSTV